MKRTVRVNESMHSNGPQAAPPGIGSVRHTMGPSGSIRCVANGSAGRILSLLHLREQLGEPPHIHLERERAVAKFWLVPIIWIVRGDSRPANRGGSKNSLAATRPSLWRPGLSSFAAGREPLATDVQVSEDESVVSLAEGRRRSAPLVWLPRLLGASATARSNWRPIGDGEGVHWPDADEDISVEALLSSVQSVDCRQRSSQGA